jgi:hypothetical protein
MHKSKPWTKNNAKKYNETYQFEYSIGDGSIRDQNYLFLLRPLGAQ